MRQLPAARPRRGFAMMLVLVFLVLLLALLGVTYRQAATALRVESVRARQIVRDEGSMSAVARALVLLENGPPPTDPYTVEIAVAMSAGMRSFAVTIASEGDAQHWCVHSVPVAPGS